MLAQSHGYAICNLLRIDRHEVCTLNNSSEIIILFIIGVH